MCAYIGRPFRSKSQHLRFFNPLPPSNYDSQRYRNWDRVGCRARFIRRQVRVVGAEHTIEFEGGDTLYARENRPIFATTYYFFCFFFQSISYSTSWGINFSRFSARLVCTYFWAVVAVDVYLADVCVFVSLESFFFFGLPCRFVIEFFPSFFFSFWRIGKGGKMSTTRKRKLYNILCGVALARVCRIEIVERATFS